MRLPFVSRERFEEIKARADWAEAELRRAEAEALAAKVDLAGLTKELRFTEDALQAKRSEVDLLEALLANQPTVETLGAKEARTSPAPEPASERERPRVLSPLEVVSRANEHRNLHLHRSAQRKVEAPK